MFLIGFLSGIAFVGLCMSIILIYTAHRQNKELLQHMEVVEGVEEEEVKEIIRERRREFTKLENFGMGANLKLIKKNSIEVIREISEKYSPDARYPLYELTLEEALLLNIHISERILKSLEDKKLEIFKKLKLSKVLELNDFKKRVQSTPLYSKMERYRLLNLLSRGWMLANIANPKYWLKKIFFDGTLEIASRTLGIIIINSIGTESYRVYSRKFKGQP